MSMRVQPCAPDLSVQFQAGLGPEVSPDVEARIEAAWQREVKRRGGKLFNGTMLSVVDQGASRLVCRQVLYRWYVAQWNDEALYAELGVRPLAVSGVLACADGLVFGRRSDDCLQDAGRWELAPSGGLDMTSVRPDGSVDAAGQLLSELAEELGLPAWQVSVPRPFALLVDERSHVRDIAFHLDSGLAGSELQDIHRTAGSAEYSRLEIIGFDALDDFLGTHSVSPASHALLSEWRRAAPGKFGFTLGSGQ